MISVQLGYMKDEVNKVDKNFVPVVSVIGNMKENTTITDPTFLFDGYTEDVAGFNYMYVSDFKRYYFINNIEMLEGKLYRVYGHVDVLMSYAEGIKANTGIVKRQENKWNLYLNDGAFLTYQNPINSTHPFPSGFTGESFVLAVAGS